MKKAPIAAILITGVFICLLLGIFIGRNLTGGYVFLNAPGQADENASAPKKIDINTATAEQLTILPGVGEVLAKRIITYRQENGPFESTSDLLQVEGIGKSTLLDIQEYIIVGG